MPGTALHSLHIQVPKALWNRYWAGPSQWLAQGHRTSKWKSRNLNLECLECGSKPLCTLLCHLFPTWSPDLQAQYLNSHHSFKPLGMPSKKRGKPVTEAWWSEHCGISFWESPGIMHILGGSIALGEDITGTFWENPVYAASNSATHGTKGHVWKTELVSITQESTLESLLALRLTHITVNTTDNCSLGM